MKRTPLGRGFIDLDQPHAPVMGTFCLGNYCDEMETFMLVYDALVIAAIVVILLGIKPVR
jgi:hypothetical protein